MQVRSDSYKSSHDVVDGGGDDNGQQGYGDDEGAHDNERLSSLPVDEEETDEGEKHTDTTDSD